MSPMNPDIRRSSVSLDSMGFSQSAFRLSRDEIASIAGTHFDVPVVADTYEIILTAAEQALRVPQDIKRRVGRWAYTWAMYTADSAPDPRVGVRGDVWVQSTPGRRRIFILGGQHGWYEWSQAVDTRKLKAPPHLKTELSLHNLVASHPWLRHRRLEFDGIVLRWGSVDARPSQYVERLNQQVQSAGWPDYSKITLGRVAEHLCVAAPPSRGRVVVPASKSSTAPTSAWPSRPTSPPRTRSSESNRSPPVAGPSRTSGSFSGNSTSTEQPSASALTPRADAFGLAQKAFPRPGMLPRDTVFHFPFNATPPSPCLPTPPLSFTSTPPFTFAANYQSPFSPATPSPLNRAPAPAPQVYVKTEEEEEKFVLAQLERPRDSASATPAPQSSQWVKMEVDSDVTSALAGSASPAPDAQSNFFSPVAARRSLSRTTVAPPDAHSTIVAASTDIHQFLANMPMSLTHREELLRDLGISSMDYLRSFADAPSAVITKLTAKLQEKGFAFMEALMLRNGLPPLRQQHPPPEPAPAPESVETFLASIRPSMIQHAPVFQDIGIDSKHLPILARLDAASYVEFEEALYRRGVSWADGFLIEVALKTRNAL